jgi:hypothetical protein
MIGLRGTFPDAALPIRQFTGRRDPSWPTNTPVEHITLQHGRVFLHTHAGAAKLCRRSQERVRGEPVAETPLVVTPSLVRTASR